MAATTVSISVLAGLIGGFVVGPWIAREVQRWMGWRVVLPFLLGRVPAWSEVKGRPPSDAHVDPPYRRAVAVTTGLTFAVVALRFGWSIALLPVLVLVAGLVALSTVDILCWRIPTRFVYWTGAGVVVALVVAALVSGEARSLVGAGVGMAAYLVVLGGMHLLSPRLLGFGDVRLGGLVGLVVGWMGWDPVFPISESLSWTLLAMVLASVLGMVAGMVVLVMRWRARRLAGRAWREPYPFGPWLCAGAVVAILAAAPGPA